MKIFQMLTVIAAVSSVWTSASAGEAPIHLFLNEDSAETKIDGMNVRLRAELTDKHKKEREFTRTPRVWIICSDNGRQILSIDTADDLDPWPSVADNNDVRVSAALKSQTGSFKDLTTQMNASRVNHLLQITLDITGRAEDVARSWLQGFPIKITASPGGELKDLNLVIFPEAKNSSFRAQATALIRGCEVLAH
ncbi:hypothetical protein [Agrobacterium tumefaciens]|uniref:hypothetical protein n=1 Tax=Agrobacterium tumefaciens TaxID=358 RepID=UPI001300BF9F